MFVVRKSIELDAGHRVPFHSSKCQAIHGHRYRVTAEVDAPALVPEETGRSDAGMVVDFGAIKQALLSVVHDPYDHKLILWDKDPLLQPEPRKYFSYAVGVRRVPCIPTAEELARFWAPQVQRVLRELAPGIPFRLRALEVRETPTSFATYYLSPTQEDACYDPERTVEPGGGSGPDLPLSPRATEPDDLPSEVRTAGKHEGADPGADRPAEPAGSSPDSGEPGEGDNPVDLRRAADWRRILPDFGIVPLQDLYGLRKQVEAFCEYRGIPGHWVDAPYASGENRYVTALPRDRLLVAFLAIRWVRRKKGMSLRKIQQRFFGWVGGGQWVEFSPDIPYVLDRFSLAPERYASLLSLLQKEAGEEDLTCLIQDELADLMSNPRCQDERFIFCRRWFKTLDGSYPGPGPFPLTIPSLPNSGLLEE